MSRYFCLDLNALPRLSDVSHHCQALAAVYSNSNVCIIAGGLLVHLYDCMILFQSSHRGPVHLTLTYSHSEQHIRVLSILQCYNPRDPCPSCEGWWPCYWSLAHQGHPRSHPSQSPHTSKLSWKLDIKAQCPNVVRSAKQSGGENSNGFIKTRLRIPLNFPP